MSTGMVRIHKSRASAGRNSALFWRSYAPKVAGSRNTSSTHAAYVGGDLDQRARLPSAEIRLSQLLANPNDRTGTASSIPTPSPEPGQFLNGDFEEGPSVGWGTYSLQGQPVIVGGDGLLGPGVIPHSGAWAAWLGGANGEMSYVEQRVTISAQRPHLGFWLWIDSGDACGFDAGRVLVDGAEVAALPLCAGSRTVGWVERTVDLSAYVGQAVQVRFQVDTEGSQPSSLILDDVALQDGVSTRSHRVYLPVVLND